MFPPPIRDEESVGVNCSCPASYQQNLCKKMNLNNKDDLFNIYLNDKS